jgi:pimeloyl-ACP methyl ester carboxylesterase
MKTTVSADGTIEREIEDLDAVIGSVGGPVMVFGRSSGAALALEAAADGLTINKIALYGPPCVGDPRRPRLPSRRELAAWCGGTGVAMRPRSSGPVRYTRTGSRPSSPCSCCPSSRTAESTRSS